MSLLEKYLFSKKSGIHSAGKGLFSSVTIKKGTSIVEYKGKKKKSNSVTDKSYAYNLSNEYVIDAKNYKKGLAHLANDANGLYREAGLRNNCRYVQIDMRVYIVATKNINAGSEILVDYGKKYWQPLFTYLRNLIKKEKQSQKQFSSHSLKTKPMAKAKKAAIKKAAVKKAVIKKAAVKKKTAVKPSVEKKVAAPKKALKNAAVKKAIKSGKLLMGKSGKSGG